MGKFRFQMYLVLVVIFFWWFFFTIGEYSVAVVLEQLPSASNYESLEELKNSLEITLNEEPNNMGALIGLAEVHFYLGDHLADGEQVLIWEEGLEYAQRAVELDIRSAAAHYWVASTMGRIGNAQGIFKSLFFVSPMFEHLETALELDPDHAWAHFILSHLYQEIPVKPFGKGDRQKALDHALIALNLEPTEPEFSLHYATLLSKQKRPREAKKILEKLLDNREIELPDHLRIQAENLLDSL